ncbi:MAG TPA: Uma2 family endonuclease [Thermoanaerobaculia bacterium]|nr:Uma2 family endonuclease [Thermoanaerobaculia bacterium]
METASKSVGLTYDDLLRLPDDRMRHELIGGEHHVSPAPSRKHQRVATNVHGLLFIYLREHRLGRVYSAPLDVVFTQSNVVEPDVLYVSREREERQATERNLGGAPDLVVEVLSPSTRRVDEGAKHRLYERFGVPEYWVIDPELEIVKVYRLEGGRLELELELRSGEGTAAQILSTPLLPGLAIPVHEIFD